MLNDHGHLRILKLFYINHQVVVLPFTTTTTAAAAIDRNQTGGREIKRKEKETLVRPLFDVGQKNHLGKWALLSVCVTSASDDVSHGNGDR